MINNNSIFKLYYEWWKNIDKFIFILIVSMFLLGLFFSLVSTSIIASDKLDTNTYYFFLKHVIFIVLAIFLLIGFSFLSQKKLYKFSKIFFVITFFFLILVPFIGTEVKGSTRWLNLPLMPRFQPIELLKPFFIVVIASVLSQEKYKNINLKYFLSLLIIFPIIILLIAQPDIGQTLLIILIWFSLIFVSGMNLIFFFSFLGLVSIVLSYIIFFVPKFDYIQQRLFSFLDPNSGNNYQSEKASEAIINGGFFGKGIGEGKLNSRIPEAHTDYIISVISEEFGILIIILIMLIFLILSYQVLRKINFESDNKAKLVLVGSITIILIQAFIHIGVNIRFLPTTGMTLPFLSYGGSSIVSTAILSGIILNLTKRKLT